MFFYRNYVFVTVSLFLAALIAIFFKNINMYIAFVGGYFSIVFTFIMPSTLYIKTNNYSIYHYKNIIAIIIMAIGSSLGIMGATMELIDIINNK